MKTKENQFINGISIMEFRKDNDHHHKGILVEQTTTFLRIFDRESKGNPFQAEWFPRDFCKEIKRLEVPYKLNR